MTTWKVSGDTLLTNGKYERDTILGKFTSKNAALMTIIIGILHVTPILRTLHWFSVEYHSIFKTATLVYGHLHTGCLNYLDPYLLWYISFLYNA